MDPVIPEEVMTAWVALLGSPPSGPTIYSRTGEIEEPSGEIIPAATWRFPPEERETFKARIEGFVASAAP